MKKNYHNATFVLLTKIRNERNCNRRKSEGLTLIASVARDLRLYDNGSVASLSTTIRNRPLAAAAHAHMSMHVVPMCKRGKLSVARY